MFKPTLKRSLLSTLPVESNSRYSRATTEDGEINRRSDYVYPSPIIVPPSLFTSRPTSGNEQIFNPLSYRW
jgi:hypothetical protein